MPQFLLLKEMRYSKLYGRGNDYDFIRINNLYRHKGTLKKIYKLSLGVFENFVNEIF